MPIWVIFTRSQLLAQLSLVRSATIHKLRPSKTSAASPGKNFTDGTATVSSGRRQPRNLPSRMGGRTSDCGVFLAPLVAVHEPPQTLRHFWSGRL